MTLKQQNRGIHGGSSLMLSTLVLSNENQACRMWREAPASIGGGGCHKMDFASQKRKEFVKLKFIQENYIG